MIKVKYKLKKNKFGFLQINPKPSVQELDSFYNQNFYTSNYKNFNNSSLAEQLKDSKFYNYKWEKIYNNFLKLKKSVLKKKVLDIGCGWGQCLLYLKKKGLDCYGIDPSTKAINYCNKKGLKGEVSNLSNLDIFKNIRFDFVIMNNVLEHLRNPVETIKKINKILKKNGIIFIEVPNDFNTFQLVGKKANKIKNDWWVSPPAHLNYFSHKTLQNFLIMNNFLIKKKDTSFPIEIFLLFNQNYVGNQKLGKKLHNYRVSFEKNMINTGNRSKLENFYEKLAELNLGRTAIVYAQKR